LAGAEVAAPPNAAELGLTLSSRCLMLRAPAVAGSA